MDRKIQQMMQKYEVGSANLFHVRNRNEVRVVKALPRILAEYPGFEPEVLDLEDIFALALNKLPPRYVQHGTIVLNEPVGEDEIHDALRFAVDKVRDSPSYNE